MVIPVVLFLFANNVLLRRHPGTPRLPGCRRRLGVLLWRLSCIILTLRPWKAVIGSILISFGLKVLLIDSLPVSPRRLLIRWIRNVVRLNYMVPCLLLLISLVTWYQTTLLHRWIIGRVVLLLLATRRNLVISVLVLLLDWTKRLVYAFGPMVTWWFLLNVTLLFSLNLLLKVTLLC